MALHLCSNGAQVGGTTTVRFASHKAQGAVNKAKDGPGKRLGAKKSGGTCFSDLLVLGDCL